MVTTADGYLPHRRYRRDGHRTGYTKIVDRKKDMILVSGFNVYPNEIEEVIASASRRAGMRRDRGDRQRRSGEAVKAFVVKKDANLTAEDLIKYLRYPVDQLQGAQADRIPRPTCRRPMSAKSCAASCATRKRRRPLNSQHRRDRHCERSALLACQLDAERSNPVFLAVIEDWIASSRRPSKTWAFASRNDELLRRAGYP